MTTNQRFKQKCAEEKIYPGDLILVKYEGNNEVYNDTPYTMSILVLGISDSGDGNHFCYSLDHSNECSLSWYTKTLKSFHDYEDFIVADLVTDHETFTLLKCKKKSS